MGHLMNRRRFFSALTSAFAAGAAAPALAQAPAASPQRIDRLRLDAAESIFGVDFTEAEEQMALGSVNRNLQSFEELRKLNVPLDTEPAVTFRPYLPGKKPTGKSTPGAKLRVTKTTVPANLTPEQIAFLPVTALATLIETKRITSTELTKIYLDRLKRYGETLKCVVTLTEELALQQAAAADAEIKAGKYRGPLHGIPWGAKDLLATKGIKTTSTPPSSNDCAMPVRCWSPSCQWARWRRAACGSAVRRATPGTPNAVRAVHRRVPVRRPLPDSSASRSARRPWARSSRRR
jgi:hypothetical protein